MDGDRAPADHSREIIVTITCDCGNDTFRVSVDGKITCAKCGATERPDFSTKSAFTTGHGGR